MAKPIFTLFLVVCILGIEIGSVEAHGMSVFAWVENNTVYVESKFSGGKRVNAGKIRVLDPSGTELLSGVTDPNGEFSFEVPKKTDLKIVLEAGAGHRAEWTIAAAEIEMQSAEKKPVPAKGATVKGMVIGLGLILGLTAITAYIRKRKKQ